jgi:hypothetical protein
MIGLRGWCPRGISSFIQVWGGRKKEEEEEEGGRLNIFIRRYFEERQARRIRQLQQAHGGPTPQAQGTGPQKKKIETFSYYRSIFFSVFLLIWNFFKIYFIFLLCPAMSSLRFGSFGIFSVNSIHLCLHHVVVTTIFCSLAPDYGPGQP